VATQIAAGDGASAFCFSNDGTEPGGEHRPELQYVRASGLAQARLQLAVLSGNRRRALEQIDRLVAIDKHLERLAAGEAAEDTSEMEADLADQRLAIATEKLTLTSGVELPRLEPAFGGGMGTAIGPEEDVEIVEDQTLKNRIFHILLWGFGFIILCLGVTAAVLVQF
jgi:hypothetical protein